MGYISLPLVLNAIIGLTSYYCVILKMVILHDAIKWFRIFFLYLKQQKQKSGSLKTTIKKAFF